MMFKKIFNLILQNYIKFIRVYINFNCHYTVVYVSIVNLNFIIL